MYLEVAKICSDKMFSSGVRVVFESCPSRVRIILIRSPSELSESLCLSDHQYQFLLESFQSLKRGENNFLLEIRKKIVRWLPRHVFNSI